MGASAAWIKSMNLQCDQVWHELCTKKSKSFSSIFHFQNPAGAPEGAPSSFRCKLYSILMVSLILRRLVLTLPVIWIVVTLVFGLIHMVPGDPVAQMLGEGASVTQVERLRHELGLDRPVFEQYRVYMTGLLHGDLGHSFRNQEAVAASIRTRYPATIQLAVASLMFSIIVGIPLGVLGAVRR